MFTLTCLSTSRMPSCLEAFFLPLSAWGNKGGGGGGGGGGVGHAFFRRIFFDDYVFRLLFLMFSDFSHRFGHWLLNFLTTPQGGNCLDFIHFLCRLAEKA